MLIEGRFCVTQKEESFITNVYVKPTNTGHCHNGESECPQRYKDSIIGDYIRIALTHCSTWQLMHKEIERSTQVLINNGFSERDINRQTKKIMENWYNPSATRKSQDITIFYRDFFSTAHQEEERIIPQIVNRNVKPADQERRIKLHIYYKNKNTSNLLLRNSPNQTKETKQKSHVVYRITCKRGNSSPHPTSA
ncbi:hypothetical protein GWK47_050488 [Chionoecetes opilio]|uniref:Helix-turn-helix domain-containing protein n=1 Tax=Chionoecetes opilio TaxID=41210 RepID=A0A8J5CST1_CHIOP|nr:hypothetical protein GWK47_050488 [Chionoecetes opilio]